jgi:regulator of sigma E protease
LKTGGGNLELTFTALQLPSWIYDNVYIMTILAFVVVLGITITIHEFGHFAMAKLLKIRVLVFSLGFGPKLVGFTHGGTEYRLSPIPIGGYVKMAGETHDEGRKGEPDEFLSHPKWHRFLIAISGPFMNILLAVFILTFSYMQGIPVMKYTKDPAIVGPVIANSIAKEAGLQSGDRMVSVNGAAVKTWEDMELALLTAPKDSLNVTVERNGQILYIHFNSPKEAADPTALGFKPFLQKMIVLSLEKNKPAQRAGMEEGDEIISVHTDGKIARDYDQIVNLISKSNGVPLDFEIFRPFNKPKAAKTEASGSTLHLSITPVEETKGRAIAGFGYGFPSELEKFGFLGALRQSVGRTYEMMALNFQFIGRIFKGTASVKTLSGPIGIAQMSGSAARTAARTGDAQLFWVFLGLVSLSLGFFNLLPIPILDGGVMALLLIEGLMGRDLSLNLKEKIVQVSFVFLILLFGFVIFNDLSKTLDFNRLFR